MFVPPAPTISGVAGKSRVLCLQKRIGILRSYFGIFDGGRSSMVEPQIVVLVVAGSSPVGHPKLIFDLRWAMSPPPKSKIHAVSVAQPDRASDFGSEGCGFESLQTRSYESENLSGYT